MGMGTPGRTWGEPRTHPSGCRWIDRRSSACGDNRTADRGSVLVSWTWNCAKRSPRASAPSQRTARVGRPAARRATAPYGGAASPARSVTVAVASVVGIGCGRRARWRRRRGNPGGDGPTADPPPPTPARPTPPDRRVGRAASSPATPPSGDGGDPAPASPCSTASTSRSVTPASTTTRSPSALEYQGSRVWLILELGTPTPTGRAVVRAGAGGPPTGASRTGSSRRSPPTRTTPAGSSSSPTTARLVSSHGVQILDQALDPGAAGLRPRRRPSAAALLQGPDGKKWYVLVRDSRRARHDRRAVPDGRTQPRGVPRVRPREVPQRGGSALTADRDETSPSS